MFIFFSFCLLVCGFGCESLWIYKFCFAWVCVWKQMTFTDAMRSKARLSITGNTGENGRVLTPDFSKAVHAVPYLRPGMAMPLSVSELSWVPYTHTHTHTHTHTGASMLYLHFHTYAHTCTYSYIQRNIYTYINIIIVNYSIYNESQNLHRGCQIHTCIDTFTLVYCSVQSIFDQQWCIHPTFAKNKLTDT